jgi:hypothetical protein
VGDHAGATAVETTHDAIKSCCHADRDNRPAERLPSKERHEKRCACESMAPKTAPDAPQQVNLAPQPLLAVLPRPDRGGVFGAWRAALTSSHAPVYRPCTTLLQQHCALIV